ncbi:SMI1/KNR4 family protein [Flammeovirga sp. OC4]|uniref:SMI1/KNR4 family protein n=1 Tax=Flammeovirga sp. OC4 TaxID=1382345 RepID=UPI0005C4A530|nr:SMI1/KNR4 family protein [Flammeovirga sp. OC4]
MLSQFIKEEPLIPQENLVLDNIDTILTSNYGIRGFHKIHLFAEKTIIDETTGVKKLCYEDENQEESYWIGQQKEGLEPGILDYEKMLVIGNLDYDVPLCLDFRSSLKQPSVIWLSDKGGWEKIAESYKEFIQTLSVK